MKSPLVKASAAILGAILLGGSSQPATWAGQTDRTENGHRVGNPDGSVQLIGWASYTCPHCAHFTHDGDPVLALAYLPTGQVSYEIRAFVRNPVDLSATLLAFCGEPAKFMPNHELLMRNQAVWLGKAQTASEVQVQRWNTGTLPSRMRAIATDLDLYELIERNGYDRPTLDRCLADEALAVKLANATRADAEAFGIEGTPSFALNGTLLDHVHGWGQLQPHLDAALSQSHNP